MNYVAAYDNLIRTRKERVLVESVKFENHHVIMKSMGGTDEPENLVKLTHREHFLAHWLLWRIHRNRQTAYAFHMLRSKGKFSSIAYAESKEAVSALFSSLAKKTFTGKAKSEVQRNNMSKSQLGIKKSKAGIPYFTNSQLEKQISSRKQTYRERTERKIEETREQFLLLDFSKPWSKFLGELWEVCPGVAVQRLKSYFPEIYASAFPRNVESERLHKRLEKERLKRERASHV